MILSSSMQGSQLRFAAIGNADSVALARQRRGEQEVADRLNGLLECYERSATSILKLDGTRDDFNQEAGKVAAVGVPCEEKFIQRWGTTVDGYAAVNEHEGYFLSGADIACGTQTLFRCERMSVQGEQQPQPALTIFSPQDDQEYLISPLPNHQFEVNLKLRAC